MAIILSAGLNGVNAVPIHIEVDIAKGMLPKWSTVGLAESAVRESKDRVISAIHNCGYEFPYHRITLNLAPADLKKTGTAYDLPIAIGLLSAAELLPQQASQDCLFLGELSLTGSLRPIRGALSIAILAKQLGIQKLILPPDNFWEAHAVKQIEVLAAPDLPSVVEYLTGRGKLFGSDEMGSPPQTQSKNTQDFREIIGQFQAKRALEIAASGFHHTLLNGPPGTGKSLLASRIASILPPMAFEESLGTSQIYSMLGLIKSGDGLITERPFRSPHHSISDAGLIGGGTWPRPGEVSLAHNGVLFLDELPEFRKNTLESLRQPIENRQVTITRAMTSLTYPANFLMIAAKNPCPCGQLSNPHQVCRCHEGMLQKYQNKLSGPLLDRIDIKIEVPVLNYREISGPQGGETSEEIRNRVLETRKQQLRRFENDGIFFNSQMGPKEIKKYCRLDDTAEKILENAVNKWGWSARGYHRILKVARTIADMAAKPTIHSSHLYEAIGYRSLKDLTQS